MNPTKPVALVPPRPNLGPEPWDEARPWEVTVLIFGLCLTAMILLVLAGWRARRSRARRLSSPEMFPAQEVDGSPSSRRDRLIALSLEVREAFVARFGPAWRSKTTEEIAREAGLEEEFGPENAARLIEFLKIADRAKFSASAESDAPLPYEADEGWIVEFVAKAGAASTIKGK